MFVSRFVDVARKWFSKPVHTTVPKLTDTAHQRRRHEMAVLALSRNLTRELVLVPQPCEACRRKAAERERWRIELAAELAVMQTIKAAERGEVVPVVVTEHLIGETTKQ